MLYMTTWVWIMSVNFKEMIIAAEFCDFNKYVQKSGINSVGSVVACKVMSFKGDRDLG